MGLFSSVYKVTDQLLNAISFIIKEIKILNANMAITLIIKHVGLIIFIGKRKICFRISIIEFCRTDKEIKNMENS